MKVEEIRKQGNIPLRDLYGSNFVFGEGPIPCDIMFVGEGPGKDEDTWGKPFIGRAGNVLTKILNKVKIKRSEVYITNAVKQRPPENRTPLFQEIMLHRPFLFEEIKKVSPKVIVLLGKTAIKAILGKDTNESMSFHRKYKFLCMNVKVICTYHPASLLYGGNLKPMLEDFKQIKILLGIGAKHEN